MKANPWKSGAKKRVFVPMSEMTVAQIKNTPYSAFTDDELDKLHRTVASLHILEKDKDARATIRWLARTLGRGIKQASDEIKKKFVQKPPGQLQLLPHELEGIAAELPRHARSPQIAEAIANVSVFVPIAAQDGDPIWSSAILDFRNKKQDENEPDDFIAQMRTAMHSYERDLQPPRHRAEVLHALFSDDVFIDGHNENLSRAVRNDLEPHVETILRAARARELVTIPVSAPMRWAVDYEATVKKLLELIPPENRPPSADEIIYRFKDGNYVRRLQADDLFYEGFALKHCVKDPDLGYEDAVRAGEIEMWSIRTPVDRPRLTLEVAIDAEGRPVRIKQAKGLLNRLAGWVGDRGEKFKEDEVRKIIELAKHFGMDPFKIDDLRPGLERLGLLRENPRRSRRRPVYTFDTPYRPLEEL